MLEKLVSRKSANINFANKLMDVMIYDSKFNNGKYIKYLADYRVINTLIYNGYVSSKIILELKKSYSNNPAYRAMLFAGRQLNEKAIKDACYDIKAACGPLLTKNSEKNKNYQVYNEKERTFTPIVEKKEEFFNDETEEQASISTESVKPSPASSDIINEVKDISKTLNKIPEIVGKHDLSKLEDNKKLERELRDIKYEVTLLKNELSQMSAIIADGLETIELSIRAKNGNEHHLKNKLDTEEEVELLPIDEHQDIIVEKKVNPVEIKTQQAVVEPKEHEFSGYLNSKNMNLDSEIVDNSVMNTIINQEMGYAGEINELPLGQKVDIVRQNKYKFYLNANHAISIDGNLGQVHPHSWEIIIDVLNTSDDFIQFNNIEKILEDMFAKYSKKVLNDIPPFDKLNPTLENICLYFLKAIQRRLEAIGFKLLMIEMSETPSRSFIINISDTVDRDIISEENIVIENYIDSFLDSVSN